MGERRGNKRCRVPEEVGREGISTGQGGDSPAMLGGGLLFYCGRRERTGVDGRLEVGS